MHPRKSAWILATGLACSGSIGKTGGGQRGETGEDRPAGLDSGPSQSEGGAESGLDSGAPAHWRSALYPIDWEPGFEVGGWALADFSYAGFGGDGRGLPELDGIVRSSVVDFGADPSGVVDSTAAFQSAIDSGTPLVWVPAGDYRLEGELLVERSGVVIAGEGAELSRLWFSKTIGMSFRSHIEFRGTERLVAELETRGGLTAGSNRLELATVEGLSSGLEVTVGWVISPEFVAAHDMTGYWEFSLGEWRPFFRRTIVSVETDPPAVVLDVPLRYGLDAGYAPSLRVVEGAVSGCGVRDLGLSNSTEWYAAWAQTQVHVLSFRHAKDCWVKSVASWEGLGEGDGYHLQSSGIEVEASRRITIEDSYLGFAQNRGEGGNGYLYEIRQSNEVLVRDCVGENGRHNFIQNWDFGSSGLVFLRNHTVGGEAFTGPDEGFATLGASEFHHALAMSNLIDSCTVDDGWKAVNRLGYSSGAGHTATETVFWNNRGTGILSSYQYGKGYVIGTDGVRVYHDPSATFEGIGSEPEDWVEGLEEGARLDPPSLFEDQRERRLMREG